MHLELVFQVGNAGVCYGAAVYLELILIVLFADLRSALVLILGFETELVPVMLGGTKLLLFQLHFAFHQFAILEVTAAVLLDALVIVVRHDFR